MKLASLVIFACLVVSICPAPVSTNLDYTTTFQKFFRIKDIIDNINIKHFREFQARKVGPDSLGESADKPLTEIDLTEEAIVNDEVTKVVDAPVVEPFETSIVEVVDIRTSNEATTVAVTEGSDGVFEEVDLESAVTEAPVLGAAETETAVTETAIAATTEAAVAEIAATEAAIAEVSATEAVVVTTESAVVEVVTTEAAIAEVVTTEVAVAEVTITKDYVPDTLATEVNVLEEEESINDISDEGLVISKKTLESAKKYGYKILLKKIGGVKVPIGKIKFTVPTIETVQDEPATTEKVLTTASPEVVEDANETTEAPTAVDVVNTRTANTVTTSTPEADEESTILPPTAAPVAPADDPIISDLPDINIETLDEDTIEEGALQVQADAELAVEEMKKMNQTSISLDTCSLADSQTLLVDLAKKIVDAAPAIEEILTVGRSIQEESDPAALSLAGARLLRLLEPFLESLVPAEISSCPEASTNSVLMTMTGLAATLDTIAEAPGVEETRSSGLHKAATSLQLAAWVMAQLQASVHTMYSGLCVEGRTSSADILAALSRAVEGYLPVVTMLGTDGAVQELTDTAEALGQAGESIAVVEARSGSPLPGVECGASFSDMGLGLERLAAFLEATQAV